MSDIVERYKVITGSETGHCCFVATVVDTSRMVFGREYNVCECLDREDADAIATALNAHQQAMTDRMLDAAIRSSHE